MNLGTPYFALAGLVGFVFWSLGFWHIGRTPQIYIPARYRLGGIGIGRSVVFFLGVMAWLLITFSLAGPRKPLGLAKDPIEVNDIFFVVDLSRSMLAEDIKPNRVEAAKSKIIEFIRMRPTDRIGIVLFSEKVFTLLPLTTDLRVIEQVIPEIRVGPLGSGTNMGDAMGLALARAAQSPTKNKIMILLTDGVSNFGSTTPLQAAQRAREQQVKIYSIGIGASDNAKMPVGEGANKIYVPIPGGSVDLKILREIAEITGGKSTMARDSEALERFLGEINQLERTKIDKQGRVIYQELYWPYLFWGVLLFLMVELSRRILIREGP